MGHYAAPMRFDLADLRLFLTVVDAGSITHGAAATNLSLAAASERLRDMEVSGGVSLLDRGRRGVTPTRAGEALAHHARLVLRQVGAMQADLSEHARAIRGSVRLLANSVAIAEVLPERLAPWLAAHPRIDIDLAERPSVEIIRLIGADLAEIGIISDAVEAGSIETIPFITDRIVAVMARSHALVGEKRIPLARVLDEEQIGFDGALHQHIQDHAARSGHRLRPRIRLRTFDGVCRLAAAGAGIGLVPESAARRCRRTMPIAFVPLADAWATRRLLLCCRSREHLSPIARDLLEQLSRGE